MGFLRLFAAEVRRELKRAQAYWFDVVADQALFTLAFLLMSGVIHLLTQGNYTTEAVLVALIGFVTWRVADGCILRTVGQVTEDAKTGILEQIQLSAAGSNAIMLARSLAVFLYHSGRGLILAVVLLLILRLPIVYSPGALLVFALTQAGIFGVAYAITGCHLVYKNVSAVTVALSTALLFLTGAITPLYNAPVVYTLSRFLPLTVGIELLREVLLSNMSFVTLLQQPDFFWLLINSAVYGLIGWLVLHWGYNTARRDGSLAHY